MKFRFLVILFFINSFFSFSQVSGNLLQSSIFYTNANYDNENKSNSFAFYNTLEISKNIFLLNSYDNLTIDNPAWDYNQQMFLGGVSTSFSNVFLKFIYLHLKGNFNYNASELFNYSDFTNLYSFDFIFQDKINFYGIAYSHLNATGVLSQDSLPKQTVNQFTLRYERILGERFLIAVRPNFSLLQDGRNLFSLGGKIHYLPFSQLLIKVGGFAGKRAYYFDNDLLTLFNQNETQKSQIYLQAELNLIKQITLIASYQNTTFENYEINYFVIGIRSRFYL
ncbi:MAG: hypothetical protein C0425_04225 [Chlorobiaceae bacterium]|nr:hypothetical protein [Chlorobiaceae bacterium]MBA4309523.1 hypothetical protein [Chlorobiaceae bacterium]